jgi:selenide,water dikinase
MLRLLRDSARGGVVTIVDGADTILGDGSPCRDLARETLERAGVCFALGSRVVDVERDRVRLASGAELPADFVLWATAGAPPRTIAESGLPHDARGRVLVDHTLRARSGAPVWAAGDCAVPDETDARSESQQSAQLERSLRDALDGASPRILDGRASEPCLLDTGDGRALVEWGFLHGHARWAGWVRERRDRRLVSELHRP